jgi:spore photoproduct lyase
VNSVKFVYLDPEVKNDPQVPHILKRLHIPVQGVATPEQLFERIQKAADPIKAGKEILFLTLNRGRFIRDCPGTRDYQCCAYMILHVGTFCTMDCAYCILQSYFHPPVLQYFVNHDAMLKELDGFFDARAHRRIGTGEYTDSLIWEPATPMVGKLIDRFADQSHAVLELKTKTARVDSLETYRHNRRTIVAWSLNTEKIVHQNEIGTARIDARLKAARKCQRWGYPLAFHIDPIVLYDGAADDYRALIQKLAANIDPGAIVWISLGAFRCMPSLKTILHRRFPESEILHGELISGLDGKLRYYKPLRIEMYRNLVSWIRAWAPEVTLYFCMESQEVWQEVLDIDLSARGGLNRMLDRRAVAACQLAP